MCAVLPDLLYRLEEWYPGTTGGNRSLGRFERLPCENVNDAAAAESSHTILVVDDNESNRFLAEATLHDEGYAVVLAKGGLEGLDRFRTHRPDCIVLDVKMPDMDGFSMCEAIRKLPGGGEIPILFLTGLRDVDTFDRALRAGGDDFLTKPVHPAELAARVQTALKLGRMRAELRDQYDLLKRQRDDLMRVQLQKEQLIAFVVHDLKNPVNSMDLHAQVLLRDKTLPDHARRSAQQVRSEAKRLTRMILNLLDISRADGGTLIPRPVQVDVSTVLDDVFGELELSAESRRVTLTSSIAAVTMTTDEDFLRRTLSNLVENAIRHASSPGEVSVEVVRDEPAKVTEIRVQDSGDGVPEDMRQRIFDPYIRLASGDPISGQSGRGLGLTFCRVAVESQGGTIWVENTSPGARFCVRLPDERPK